MTAFLLAHFSEPGTHVSHKEFQDWCDNEHILLRNRFPSFQSSARFSASDSKTPTWLALYDIRSSGYSDETGTLLQYTSSKPEADLVSRLEVFGRRTCVLFEDSWKNDVTRRLGAERPTHFLCTHGLDVGDHDYKEAERWAEGRFEALGRDVDGWVRTRVFEVLGNSMVVNANGWVGRRLSKVFGKLMVGTAVEKTQTSQYFVVHEFTSPAASSNPTFREMVDKPFVSEVREWVPMAQGK